MDDKLKNAVTFILTAGYQLEKEAFDLLENLSRTRDPLIIVKKTIKEFETFPEKPLFISRECLEKISSETCYEELSPSHVGVKRLFRAHSRDVETDLKVVVDPTDKVSGTGSVKEFLEYFQDRFKRVKRFLMQRIDARDTIPLSIALKASLKSKVKVIGMVIEKREYKQTLTFRIEDLEASATVLVSYKTSPEVFKKAQQLLLDQVVCLSAVKVKDNLLLARDIIWPDLPQRKPRKASLPVNAVLISDLHVGSKMFMSDAFNKFVLWLNGRYGEKSLRNMASHVKYVVIAGDLVDGIGVYPGQMDELLIKDVYSQYKALSRFIEKIPDYIEVIFIPGNHDVSRKALPQPAIPKDYAEPLYEVRKVHSFGNPCSLQLHGVELLLCHGRSLDDLASTVPNISFQTPDKAMQLLLKCRHLAPIYGRRTPIAPEKRDFMIIDGKPDIFHTGHVHVLKYGNYRGTLLVNSGAWQEQTEFQRRMGLVPTPGIASIVNLETLQVTPVNFV